MEGVTAIGIAADDWRLVQDLRRGAESAFLKLLERYHQSMLRLAQYFVHDRAAAEDVVQETWLGVLQSLGRFEGRSSLKTWIFRILTNRARTRHQRDGHSIPFSALALAGIDDEADPAVDLDRFIPADAARWAGHWVSFPRNWAELPEERLLSQETLVKVRQAIDALPPAQRQVIALRDLEGWSSAEVREALAPLVSARQEGGEAPSTGRNRNKKRAGLEISEANQRVLLHRARSKVRRALEQYLDESV